MCCQMRGDDTFINLMKQRRYNRSFRGSVLLFSILLFFVFAFFWAARTEIDDVTRTDGRVVPSSTLQVVQAPDGGAVNAVLVREGDLVETDVLLMKMDQTQFAGHLDQERQQAFALRARLVRLRSEVERRDLVFPEELERYAPELIASERALYDARQIELAAEIDVLGVQRLLQLEALEEAENLLFSARNTMRLVNQQLRTIEPLVESGLEPQTSLLQLQIQMSEWEGRLAQASSQVVQERARIEEIDQRIAAMDVRYQSEALEDLNRTTSELAGLNPMFAILEQRLRETEIRSPIPGIINQVFVSPHGGIVAAGAELLEIVPIEDSLLVQAYVQPSDIAFLHVGQRVNVKITAYDFSRYGALEGQVDRISAGPSIHPERDESVFVVDVSTKNQLKDAADQPLPIVPGMVAEVELVSGQKSVLDYIFQPVVRVKDRAFRD